MDCMQDAAVVRWSMLQWRANFIRDGRKKVEKVRWDEEQRTEKICLDDERADESGIKSRKWTEENLIFVLGLGIGIWIYGAVNLKSELGFDDVILYWFQKKGYVYKYLLRIMRRGGGVIRNIWNG